MSDCLFCRIAAGEIPAKIVTEDDQFIAFRDIAPQAPTHILVIPRKHIASLDAADDAAMLGKLLALVRTHANAGQAVDHLHAHILGGRRMTWPPG
jgi:histidine triad (HIT) family protein